MIKSPPKCHVCFFRFQNHHITLLSECIACSKCGITAHKFCYLPSAKRSFICDVCNHSAKSSTRCYLCGNDGLLKKVNTGEFAHPVCLMFSRSAFVISYENLSFFTYKENGKKKGIKCSICKKVDSNVIKCFEKSCRHHAHMYCILKTCWEGESSWKHNLKIYERSAEVFLDFYEAKFKKYIKQQSALAYKAIWSEKKFDFNIPLTLVYCLEHENMMINCNCMIGFTEVMDWVGCDVCEYWYHCECEKISYDEAQSLEEYICSNCQKWHKTIKAKKTPIINTYPRVHFYDLVYIQYYCQKLEYRISEELMNLLSRTPFLPSFSYAFGQFKLNILNPLTHQGINFKDFKAYIERLKIKSLQDPMRREKALLNTLFKLDFLASPDFIRSLKRIKKFRYTLEDLYSFFKEYQKSYNRNSQIKQILSIFEKFDDDISDSDSEAEIVEAKELIDKHISDLHNSKDQDIETNIRKLFRAILSNPTLKNYAQTFAGGKRQFSPFFEPINLYKDAGSIVNHLKVKDLFRRYQGSSDKEQRSYKKKIEFIFSTSSDEVKRNNFTIYQLIDVDHPKSTADVSEMFYMDEGIKERDHSLNQHISKAYVLEELVSNLSMKWLRHEFKQKEINDEQIRKFKNILSKHFEGQAIYQMILIYLDLCQSLYEITECTNDPTETSILTKFLSIPIKSAKFKEFCTFFEKVLKLPLSYFHCEVNSSIETKFIDYLDYMKKRKTTIANDHEFAIVKTGLDFFNISDETFLGILERDGELTELLADVENRKYEDPNLIEINLPKLEKAIDFCQKFGLSFRLPKIKEVLTHYQLFGESLTLFPHYCVVKPEYIVPVHYKLKAKNIDYSLAKHFLKKLNIARFPRNEYMMIKVESLCREADQFYEILSKFLLASAKALENGDDHNLMTMNRVNKEILEKEIFNHKGDFITLIPELMEIEIITENYNNLIRKAKEELQNDYHRELNIVHIYTELMKIPFEVEDEIISDMEYLLQQHSFKRNENGYFFKIDESRTLSERAPILYDESKSENQKILQILIEIQEKPRMLSLQNLKKLPFFNNIWNNESEYARKLRDIILDAENLEREHGNIIQKFKRRQLFHFEEVQKIKRMISQYGKLLIQVESIEQISHHYANYIRARNNEGENRQSFIANLHPSFINDDLIQRKAAYTNRKKKFSAYDSIHVHRSQRD